MVKLAAIFYLGLALLGVGLNALQKAPLVPFALGPRLWPALLASALMTAATLVFSAFGARRWAWSQRLEATFRAALGPLTTGEVLALAVSSGIAEEIFFRGALQPALIRLLGSDPLGLIATTIAFGVIHTGRDKALRIWTLFALVLGLFLGAVTLASGNVLPAILCHVTVNAVNLHRIARPLAR